MKEFPTPKILQKSIEHLCLELFLMWEKSEVGCYHVVVVYLTVNIVNLYRLNVIYY
jgi:hypothetical protein